ncbi:atlastin-2-like [Chiloscyllium plagiosum]|uniref:atlastin-2-like n=1 Tax=Chiloscyllium plagiosum TaxID=36176 RepID=UPI001CB7BBC0|nr:atlastin-2-like [Chiloscyllium plagiosum]
MLAKNYYQKAMEGLCGGDKAYLSPSKIRERHQVYLEAAIEKFRATKKMGSQALIMQSEDRLTRDISEMLLTYLKFNQSKNLFSIVRTPSAMLLLIISMHVLSGFLGLLGFGFLSVIFNFVIGVCSLTLLTWSYVKYTGQSPLLGEIIDSLSERILSGVSERCISTPVPSRRLQGVPGTAWRPAIPKPVRSTAALTDAESPKAGKGMWVINWTDRQGGVGPGEGQGGG